MNPNPIIFPKLISLYNEHPRLYYEYLERLWCTRGQAKEIKNAIQKWIEETNYHTYLNAN